VLKAPSLKKQDRVGTSAPVAKVVGGARRIAEAMACVILYWGCATLCLRLSIDETNVSPIWIASGVGLGAVLLGTRTLYVAIWFAAFSANVLSFVSHGALSKLVCLSLSAIIATGNTLEAAVGKWLGRSLNELSWSLVPPRMHELENQPPNILNSSVWWLKDSRAICVFVLATGLACLVSACIGSFSHWLFNSIPRGTTYWRIGYTWWSGDFLGILLLVPTIVIFRTATRTQWNSLVRPRTLVAYGTVVGMCLGCFGEFAKYTITQQILLCMIPAAVVILAFTVELIGVIVGVLVITIMAVLYTSVGIGPFAVSNKDESWLLVQSYVAIVTLIGFVVSALVSETSALATGLATMRERETREEYERKLRESTKRLSETSADLQGVLATFPDKYFWMDPDGTLRRFFSTDSTYVPPEVFLNKKLKDVMPASVAGLLGDALARASTTKTIVEIDYPLASNGNDEWFEARMQQLESGQILVIIRDITSRKRTEARLQQLLLDRQLDAQLLAQRATELSRSNAELEQFAYVASHDLREPLRMVRSFCSLLQEKYSGHLEPKAKEYLEYAVDGAKRLQFMVDDLLEYSRVGKGEYKIVKVSLGSLVHQAMDNVRASIDETGATISFESLPEIHSDPQRMTQLLQNLFSNSIKFAGEKPPMIRVDCAAKRECWEISVSDNGIGIESQYFNRVFLMFQRLHCHSKYPGTGVGLAICKRIVEQHGGTIWIDSALDTGTTIRFTLPLRPTAE
jgi:signal transduction histidine kinase/integral membrane sensor domain MASE1